MVFVVGEEIFAVEVGFFFGVDYFSHHFDGGVVFSAVAFGFGGGYLYFVHQLCVHGQFDVECTCGADLDGLLFVAEHGEYEFSLFGLYFIGSVEVC